VKYAFMREHVRQFSVAAMCRVLKVSRSGFYDWCSRATSGRHQANAKLLSDIRQIHLAHRQAYGAVKTWRALNEAGIPCGKHRVARMRRNADSRQTRSPLPGDGRASPDPAGGA
jgi:hypothetical protein